MLFFLTVYFVSHFRRLLIIFVGRLFVSLCMPIVQNFRTRVNLTIGSPSLQEIHPPLASV